MDDVAVLPEGLAAMAPGAGLGAVLGRIELSQVANDQILDIAVAQYRQLCHAQARMVAVLVELGRRAGGVEPGRVVRLPAPDAFAADEIRAALRWTRHAAEWEHGLAERVVHELAGVHAAWLGGEIDRQRVLVFDRYLIGLTPAQITEICRVALPRAPKLTTGQLAVLLRRMVIAVDPEAAARWYRKGVRERDVSAYLAHDGTVVLSANGLPADEAEASCARLQDLAGAARRAGHPGLIGQILRSLPGHARRPLPPHDPRPGDHRPDRRPPRHRTRRHPARTPRSPGTRPAPSPLGGTYPTGGETLLHPMPHPEPVDLGPHLDRPTTARDDPILHRPPPEPPPPPRPTAPDFPDEPPF